MKRVLVISYYWPPSGGSGVQRWVKMCKYLPSTGWQPVVYTPENPALTSTDYTLSADIPPQVEVVRRRIVEPGQFARKSTGAQVTPINGQKKTLKQRVAMWIRGNCFIPDPRVVWVPSSVRFLKKYLKAHPVDAIVSTGPPHSMHLIARRVALATGIPWVADFRDPWTRMFYFKHLSLTGISCRIHEKLESKVLRDATVVVAVSPLVQEEFRAMTSTPVELVTNGFDDSDFPFGAVACDAPARDDAQVSSPSRFTLVHAGLFASDGNPLSLWRAIADLRREDAAFAERFRLVLCGKTDKAVLDSIARAGLEDCTENLGYISHTEVVALMKSASALMLPLRQEPEYRATLPGKLFEYLASRRPVIGIGQKDGAMAAILSRTTAGDTFDWDQMQEMKQWLKNAFDAFLQGKLYENKADLTEFSRKGLAQRYAVLLDKLIDNYE